MSTHWRWSCVLLTAIALMWTARAAAQTPYKTRNVIVVSMDGVRYSETFGDPKRELIPNLAKLEKEGTLFSQCFNTGVTITRQGHSTIATGTWQDVPLSGPRQTMPTVSEYARNQLGWGPKDCWVIFGKGMYSYAHYSSFPTYGAKYAPSFVINIGENNIEDDKKVLAKVLEVMESDKPRLMFINFGVTDHTAHTNKWELYTEAIQNCDLMVGKLWEKVQSTPGYKDATTLVFTTDHGRHNDKPDQIKGGFASHGDRCPGCQHIFLLIVGPDAKRGAVVDRRVLQIDIAPTVGELLGFQTPLAEGSALADCFVECRGVNRKLAKTPEAEKGLKLVELSKRDLLTTIAEANLSRNPAELKPSDGVEILMRGMLRAAEVTKNAKYREFVEKWARDQRGAGAFCYRCVLRVLVELAASGGPKEYLDIAKTIVQDMPEDLLTPKRFRNYVDETNAAPLLAFVARVAQLTSDESLAKKVKTVVLHEEHATEQSLLEAWRKASPQVPPMACDFPPERPADKAAMHFLVMHFMAAAELARAMPEDRVVRLYLNILEVNCSWGIREVGGVHEDPVVAALVFYQVLNVRKINSQHPIQWVEPGAPEAKPKAKQKAKVAEKPLTEKQPQAQAKQAAATAPLWSTPEAFYKGAFPYGFNLLKYQVNEKGHYADGSPLADGAALLLFAEAVGVPMPRGLGPSQVVELPAVPKGCTRVLIEFGRHKERRTVRWKGSFTVEGGEIVGMHAYSFEGQDKLDARAHTFDCTAGPATDGVVLDIRGTDQTIVKMTAEPQGMTFTLGELRQKKAIQVAAPGDQLLRAMMPQK